MSKIDRRKRRKPAPPTPLLPLRLVVLGTASLLVGLVVGILTWCATKDGSAAFLSGLASCGVALDRLQNWTGP